MLLSRLQAAQAARTGRPGFRPSDYGWAPDATDPAAPVGPYPEPPPAFVPVWRQAAKAAQAAERAAGGTGWSAVQAAAPVGPAAGRHK